MEWHFKSFREMNTEELYDLLKLRVDIFVVEQRCPYPELDGKDRFSETLHLMGRNESRDLAACLRMLPPGAGFREPSIGRVAVAPGSRGNGICRIMMAMAISRAGRIWPDRDIRISAQVYLEQFYTSLGFRSISGPYLEDGILHVGMIRRAGPG